MMNIFEANYYRTLSRFLYRAGLVWICIGNYAVTGKSTQDPVYDKLKTSISDYRKTSTWNEQRYNLICLQINNAATNQRINANQQRELLTLTWQEYVRTLRDAASAFLRTADSDDKLATFEDAIGRVSTNDGNAASALSSIRGGISNFREMIRLRSNVLRYTREKEYNAASTNGIRSRINQLLAQDGLLADNAYLTRQKNDYINELNAHLNKHKYFYEVVQPDQLKGEVANCEVFNLHRFYYRACQRGQPKPLKDTTISRPISTTN